MQRRVVADVGGTNTRIGVAENGIVKAGSVQSFRNDDFSAFPEVLEQFFETAPVDRFDDLVIAIAGPTTPQSGRLTNRNWVFHAADLSNRFAGRAVYLVNDLRALGYALPHLRDEQLQTIFSEVTRPNAQSLVIGIGTGFNVCPTIRMGEGVVACEAEYGHVHLPLSVRQGLETGIGAEQADQFPTVEDVFSGRGFKNLRSLYDGDFDDFYLRLLAEMTRELTLAYLPLDGVYFAGGVARAVLNDAGQAEFVRLFIRQNGQKFSFSPPVALLVDDYAALYGCAAFS